MKWFNIADIDTEEMDDQIAAMAYSNGTHEETLAKIKKGTARCVITEYMGETDNDWIRRVMAPVMSQASEYNYEIDPETGSKYGWQSVGDFLAFHTNKDGENPRYNAICLTRHMDNPEDCKRSQRLDRIDRVLGYASLQWFGTIALGSGCKDVKNRIANKQVI